MQPPTPQTNTQQRDRDMTEHLYDALRRLPKDIEGIEALGAIAVSAKRAAEARLNDAELNAMFSCPMDGSNKEKRELQVKQAIAQSIEYQSARKEVMVLEDEIEDREVEAKALRREFQAAIALAELHAARINAMYRIQQNTNHKDNPK